MLESTTLSDVSVPAGGVVLSVAAAVVSCEVTVSETVVKGTVSVSVASAVDCAPVLTGVVTSAAVDDSWPLVTVFESTEVSVVSVAVCRVVLSLDGMVVYGEVAASEAVLNVYSAVSVAPAGDCAVVLIGLVSSAAVEVSASLAKVIESTVASFVSVAVCRVVLSAAAAAVVSIEVSVSKAFSVAPAVDCAVALSNVPSAAVEDSWPLVMVLKSNAVSVVAVADCGVVASGDADGVSGEVTASEAVPEVFSSVSVATAVDSALAVIPCIAVEDSWLLVNVVVSTTVCELSVAG